MEAPTPFKDYTGENYMYPVSVQGFTQFPYFHINSSGEDISSLLLLLLGLGLFCNFGS